MNNMSYFFSFGNTYPVPTSPADVSNLPIFVEKFKTLRLAALQDSLQDSPGEISRHQEDMLGGPPPTNVEYEQWRIRFQSHGALFVCIDRTALGDEQITRPDQDEEILQRCPWIGMMLLDGPSNLHNILSPTMVLLLLAHPTRYVPHCTTTSKPLYLTLSCIVIHSISLLRTN